MGEGAVPGLSWGASCAQAPTHHIVVTNPPYSGQHPQRLMQFLATNGKPWLALMPSWVCTKSFYDGECFPASANVE